MAFGRQGRSAREDTGPKVRRYRMSTSISTVVYRDPVRPFERAAALSRRLLAANANEAPPEGAAVVSLDRAPSDAYRWSDPRRGIGLSWQGWAGTLALHGLVAAMIAAVAWTSRAVPPALPTVTVVFESPAAPSQPAVTQPETPPPPAVQPRAETPPVAPSAAPAPVAAKPPPRPMQVAVLPLPPPPRPVLRESAAPPQPASRTVATAPPVSALVERAPGPARSAPAATVAVVPVIPPRPASGVADNRKPVYPLAARNQRWQGRVVLQVAVAASGDPLSVHVVASSGHALLDDSAVAAVRTWRFVPASQGGRPIPGTVDVPVDFRMVD